VSHPVIPVKDLQTVTPKGKSVKRRITGLIIRPAQTHVDRRGEVVEIFNPAWKLHSAPMVYAYQASIRPGQIKGWIVHRKQADRIFTSSGVQRWVFYDDRKGSRTRGLINDFTFSERNRALLIIPTGVWHAVQNVGETEAVFFNLPTQAYDYADPDKYRLPPKNDLIPFDFTDEMTW
jgi:dTDP-4-dehydrorhamnose 3,5-epimerase